MIKIGDTVVSLEVVEQYFCCDIDQCKGMCCVEGDAGAPITKREEEEINRDLPAIKHLLPPEALNIIERDGVSYLDEDGDLVTSIIGNKDCVFCTYNKNNVCMCAFEIGYNQGLNTFKKPISCNLYPIRISEYPQFIAVNYDERKICRGAVANGKKLGIRVYQFLEGPLTRQFGAEWYAELKLIAEEYLNQTGVEAV